MVDEVPCPPGHDTTASVRTRAPVSFKRMLGSVTAWGSGSCCAQPQATSLGRDLAPAWSGFGAQAAAHGSPLHFGSTTTASGPNRERKAADKLSRRLLALSLKTNPKSRTSIRKNSGWLGSVHTLTSKRSEEHTSELQSPCNLVCRLLLEKKKKEI